MIENKIDEISMRIARIELLLQDLLAARTDPFLVGMKEISAFIRKGRSQVDRYRKKKGLPIYCLGRRLVSHPSLILQWLGEKGEIKRGMRGKTYTQSGAQSGRMTE